MLHTCCSTINKEYTHFSTHVNIREIYICHATHCSFSPLDWHYLSSYSQCCTPTIISSLTQNVYLITSWWTDPLVGLLLLSIQISQYINLFITYVTKLSEALKGSGFLTNESERMWMEDVLYYSWVTNQEFAPTGWGKLQKRQPRYFVSHWRFKPATFQTQINHYYFSKLAQFYIVTRTLQKK